MKQRCENTGKFLPTDQRFNYVEGNTNKCGIYKITNTTNGKLYVGSTVVSFKKRWQKHLERLYNNKHANPHLQYSWNKYGQDTFVFDILEECDKDKEFIIRRENHYIESLVTFGKDYNVMPARISGKKCKFSKEECNEIVEYYLSDFYIGMSEMKDKYNSNRCTIGQIVNGRYPNSTHLSPDILKQVKEKGKKLAAYLGNKNNRGLDKEAVLYIYNNYHKHTAKELSKMYNTNESTVRDIAKGRTYKDITKAL